MPEEVEALAEDQEFEALLENFDEEGAAEELEEMDEAIEPAASPEEAGEADDFEETGEAADELEEGAGDDEDIQDHLKDSMEGSLRVKRLLSRDQETNAAKRRKLGMHGAEGEALINMLLAKWAMKTDPVVKHVLEGLTLEELKDVKSSNYKPVTNPHSHQVKTVGEIFAMYVAQQREAKTAGGGALDCVSAFRHRWKLGVAADKQLRSLNHKDLRHVLNYYDGTTPLEDCITEASNEFPEEGLTISALPDAAGPVTVGRFVRLELIDPLADAAVFGDANLTFSVKLARHRKALGHVGRVIATTFEELDTLRERYKEIDETIKELEEHFAEVYHGVDCTRFATDPRFEGMEESLGAVYYNFPHAGAVGGFFDGHPLVNWRHENLMRLFFRALRSFVKPGGFVKVSSNMGAVGVRFSYVTLGAAENEFVHIETCPFLEWHLHRYGRSYGDKRDVYKRPDAKNNQSYNAQNAERDMVYCFKFAPTGETLKPQAIRLPPTLSTLQVCSEGPLKNVQGPSKAALAKQLFERFVKECTGTHVG